ncbi:alkaline phosphatase isozyme conversion aminopeptidase [Leptolyngbya sp. Heron Island J]|uniref:M28 family peptidase n=1 Tax=Leptolyngbya sp. Heron Island J TaxID=1385935 RepID=UPI0003B9AA0B|nr:M28 family peptidase [Leptolyngbya sp. Heron Island J]ESA38343.1 alkaline phosphatase isozyme conversion aminopeptidase [Leptolyngbya sp. Heron Island J]
MSIKIEKTAFSWILLGIAAQPFLSSSVQAASFGFGETAVETINYLAENLKGRSVGTQKEAETVAYLVQQLKGFGYKPTLQPFSYEWQGETLTSYNILAERTGTSGQQILLGAHYDNAPSSATLDRTNLEGVNDNASGVGVLLELAQRLEPETNNTIKFIFFGAEEIGLVGSEFYANSLSKQEIDDTLLMANLDSLVVGDKMYFNAGRGATEKPSWFRYRDLALEIAAENGIAAESNPGFNAFYPKGTGCCSDLESFDFLMPVLAAEATNWDIGAQDGFTQTSDPRVPNGRTWHDPATDNRKFINTIFPGLIEERTRNYTLIFDEFIDRVDAESVPEPMSLLGFATLGVGGLLLKRHQVKDS